MSISTTISISQLQRETHQMRRCSSTLTILSFTFTLKKTYSYYHAKYSNRNHSHRFDGHPFQRIHRASNGSWKDMTKLKSFQYFHCGLKLSISLPSVNTVYFSSMDRHMSIICGNIDVTILGNTPYDKN